MDDFAEFVELLKARNPIEDVIQETGGVEFRLRNQRGRYLVGEVHDSFKVRGDLGYYYWNATGERGDVFNWLQRHGKMDFWQAVEWLAERCHVEIPERMRPREENAASRAAFRLKVETLGLAAGVFARWLKGDEEAWGYVTTVRCWSEETITESGVGFSGRAAAAEMQEMRGEFAMHGIEADCPQAVAVLGFRGDVKGWGRAHQVEVGANYIEQGYIPGIMGRTRLVYAHYEGGRCVYLSCRNILGAEVITEGDRERIVKSFNPPRDLLGERRVYYNHEYSRGSEECVVVEGQGDAVSLGEMGIAAVATLGTSWKDLQGTIMELRRRHKDLYLGMDADAAGMKALQGKRGEAWPLADLFGPMGRVVKWG